MTSLTCCSFRSSSIVADEHYEDDETDETDAEKNRYDYAHH